MIPYDLFTTDNFMRDVITGCFIVGCTMGIFVCLLYLREQFMQGAFQNFWVSIGFCLTSTFTKCFRMLVIKKGLMNRTKTRTKLQMKLQSWRGKYSIYTLGVISIQFLDF